MRMQGLSEARATPPMLAELEERLTDHVARRLHAEAKGSPVRLIEALAPLIARQVSKAPAAESEGAAALPSPTDPFFALCRRVARRAMKGLIGERVPGATDFHREDELPEWTRGATPVAQLDGFLFYRRCP